MPAVLAHWTVAKDVAWRFIKGKKDGHLLFRGHDVEQYEGVSKFVYLGSNGPDLPFYYDADSIGKFITHTAGVSEWADVFHYNKQGEFLLNLVEVAKKLPDSEVYRRQRTMAYALGHATHLAADSVVHPYVNMIAGVYRSQTLRPGGTKMHMYCECHQDSWLAQEYWGRAITAGDSWAKVVAVGSRIPMVVLPTYTWADGTTKEVFTDIGEAFHKTHGRPDAATIYSYLCDSFENFYDNVLDIVYDGAKGPLTNLPHDCMVQHERLKGIADYYGDVLRTRAVGAAERACDDVLELFYSSVTDADKDRFRSKVRDWNLDTGWWIDVGLEGGELRIIWRHTWCG